LNPAFYKLIPSGSICNQTKSDYPANLDNFFHPYHDSFNQVAYFKTDKRIIDYIISLKKDFDKINIDIIPKNSVLKGSLTELKIINFANKLSLKEIYSHYKDIVGDLYEKAYIYNKSRKDELLKIQTENGNLLFNDKNELNRLLAGNYISEDDLLKRPLSKLTKDISEQLKLI